MKPLQGLRIADFTVHAAGPFCTHMLSQLGAECIKVESALRPDIFRKPHPVYGRMGPASFDQVASNKLSVRINLKEPRGIALAKRLVAVSAMACESFRPGVMDRLGLGYGVLCEVRPDLVMVSVSSSGQSGPDAHFAGYAPLFGAWGSLGFLTGYADGPPVEMRHVMDHSVGMTAAMAALAAVYRLRATGVGGHVDVSAREVASALAGEALLLAAAGGAPERMGNAHPRMAPHGVYPTRDADRWLAIAVGSQVAWRGLVDVIGWPELEADPRFRTEALRHQYCDALDAKVEAWTRTVEAVEASERLQKAGVAAHLSCNTRDLVEDAHLRARGMVIDVDDADGKTRAALSVPVRFTHAETALERGTPRLGEDEDYVYGELLGIGAAERAELADARIIY